MSAKIRIAVSIAIVLSTVAIQYGFALMGEPTTRWLYCQMLNLC